MANDIDDLYGQEVIDSSRPLLTMGESSGNAAYNEYGASANPSKFTPQVGGADISSSAVTAGTPLSQYKSPIPSLSMYDIDRDFGLAVNSSSLSVRAPEQETTLYGYSPNPIPAGIGNANER